MHCSTHHPVNSDFCSHDSRSRLTLARLTLTSNARTTHDSRLTLARALHRNRLKQEKEQMKESTSHLQQRVQLLEEQNRIVLHFSQACHTRLLRSGLSSFSVIFNRKMPFFRAF